jgi:hypothetical protein
MRQHTRTYIASAIGRRSLRPHIPSAAQVRRGIYSKPAALPLTPLLAIVAFFSLCCGVAVVTLSGTIVSNTTAALFAPR